MSDDGALTENELNLLLSAELEGIRRMKEEEAKKLEKANSSEPGPLSQDEIDAALASIGGEGEDDSPAPSGPRPIKIWDFKRPEKFTHENFRTFAIIHETAARPFAQALSEYLRSPVQIRVDSIEQLSYEEFIRSIPFPTFLAIVGMEPLKGNALIEIASCAAHAIIDRLLGGTGEPRRNSEPTAIERSIIEDVFNELCSSLEAGWEWLAPVSPAIRRLETNPQFAVITPPTEMVLLVTMKISIGETDSMINICLPYPLLKPVLSSANVDAFWHKASASGPGMFPRPVYKRKVFYNGASANMTAAELAGLAPGAKIPLCEEKSTSFLYQFTGFKQDGQND